MKYICLRDCFVKDRLWEKEKVYELPDDFPKYEKNFTPVGAPPVTVPSIEPAPEVPQLETEPSKTATDTPAVEEKIATPDEPPAEPTKVPPGFYFCSSCKANHKGTSKVGKKHLKYKTK